MKVVIAKHAGFCFGVERAVSLVEKALLNYKNVFTYGPIIHNPIVVSKLEDRGVKVIYDISELKSGDVLIIRSHGIAKDLYDDIERKNIKIIDATCPFVKKAYNAAEDFSKEGYSVVILGDRQHPEVEGIISYIEGEYFIISSALEARELPEKKKIGYLAQTTQDRKLFMSIKSILALKCETLKVLDTICNATSLRQKDAREVAKQVDLMFVVGGQNSGNTKRLFQICNKICNKSYLVESVKDLKNIDFTEINIVGISAGASTPNYLINGILDYLQEVDYVRNE
jgi:4-hydroxy-3-methylbut-2-enyl diphosphate reductase